MPKVQLTEQQQAARRVYGQLQRALRMLVTMVPPSDPDGIVAALVATMEKLCAKWPEAQ